MFTGADSWYGEYKRLTYNIPMVLTDDIQDAHGHQVLHVSFSHNGKMFATCSKDGFVIVSSIFDGGKWNGMNVKQCSDIFNLIIQ